MEKRHDYYDVLIRKNETGEVRRYHSDGAWFDHSLYFWTEGNFGCDCNRYLCFEWAVGYDPSEAEVEQFGVCGDGRYTVIKAIFPGGSEITIDDPQNTPTPPFQPPV